MERNFFRLSGGSASAAPMRMAENAGATDREGQLLHEFYTLCLNRGGQDGACWRYWQEQLFTPLRDMDGAGA